MNKIFITFVLAIVSFTLNAAKINFSCYFGNDFPRAVRFGIVVPTETESGAPAGHHEILRVTSPVSDANIRVVKDSGDKTEWKLKTAGNSLWLTFSYPGTPVIVR